jgi:hypothetical protein
MNSDQSRVMLIGLGGVARGASLEFTKHREPDNHLIEMG